MENWDPNEYQGRRKDQVESNEKIMGAVMSAAVLCAIIALVIKILF